MENRLEHKIREAFHNQDSASVYPKKEELWNRISNAGNRTSGVKSFWRIAAILLAVFFISGVFAGGIFINHKNNENKQLEKKYSELANKMDSLLRIPKEVITEIQIVEKEVKVYVPLKTNSQLEQKQKIEFEKMEVKTRQMEKEWKLEQAKLQYKTDSLLNEIIALQKVTEAQNIKTGDLHSQRNVMELKPEKNSEIILQPGTSTNPKMKIQLFSDPSENIKFDINSTLLKK